MRTLRDARLRCERHASNNHGVISRAEALALGMTGRTVDLRLAEGAWIRVLPGVFRVAAFPVTWRGKLHAALLWAGPDAFASHESAAALYGLDGFPEGPIVITAPRLRSVPGVRIHRLRRPARTRVVQGIRVGWVERTIADVCSVARPERCGLALDDALRKKLAKLQCLWQELEAGGRGVRGTKTLRILLTGRDDRDGKLASQLEAKILLILRRIEGARFEPQFPVVAGGKKYRIDFYEATARLGIEGHSFTWHFGDSKHDEDAERHNDLTLLGIRMLYFTWDEVNFRPGLVEAKIRRALDMSAIT